MKTPEIVCKKNGPYRVTGLENLQGGGGKTYDVKEAQSARDRLPGGTWRILIPTRGRCVSTGAPVWRR